MKKKRSDSQGKAVEKKVNDNFKEIQDVSSESDIPKEKKEDKIKERAQRNLEFYSSIL